MSNKKDTNLSWDAFQNLGNPDNAPNELTSGEHESTIDKSESIRIYLDKKNRRGKAVTLILGFEDYDDHLLKPLAKTLKSLCGVGGNLKNGEIMLQGDHRDKVLSYLKENGYSNVKKSGG